MNDAIDRLYWLRISHHYKDLDWHTVKNLKAWDLEKKTMSRAIFGLEISIPREVGLFLYRFIGMCIMANNNFNEAKKHYRDQQWNMIKP